MANKTKYYLVVSLLMVSTNIFKIDAMIPQTPSTTTVAKIFRGEEYLVDAEGKDYTQDEFKKWLLDPSDAQDEQDPSVDGCKHRKKKLLREKFPQLKNHQINSLINGPFLAVIINTSNNKF